jgi:ProP effector
MNDIVSNSVPVDGVTDPAAQPTNTRTPTPTPRSKQRKAAPRGKPVLPVLEKLFELHPQLFGAQFKPLKIGIFEDLLARNPDAFQRDDLKSALGLHARSTAYLESVASGLQRHDLDGVEVAPVAPEHVHHAIMEVFRRRQQRTKDDLRPRVVQRMAAAIDASGMTPQEYGERMRTQDETSNALLEQAVAQAAQRSAKHEALRRAFQASGQSVEAFAEMYGMDQAEVRRALG